MLPRASPGRVVYVTYDGLADPLGASQVVPYVRGLAQRGWTFDLVSFEKPGAPVCFRKPLAEGVAWTALRYHRTPTVPATGFDLLQAGFVLALNELFQRADLVHARALVPAAMSLPLATAARVPLLFDTRSFWPEEKLDQGHWGRDSAVYRAAKSIERRALRRARAVTTLTLDARSFYRNEYAYRGELRAPIQVIPTCADLDAFAPAARAARDPELGDALVLCYVGSLGHWYLEDEMAAFYAAFRRAAGVTTKLLVVTRQDVSGFREKLRLHGLGGDLVHRSATRAEMPGWIRQADASMCFIRPQLSKRASAPTKLGELLGCGVPVAVNDIGDLARVVSGSSAAVLVDDLSSPASLAHAAAELVAAARRPDTVREARALAERWYSLTDAVDAYDRVYRGMLGLAGGSVTDEPWPRAPGISAAPGKRDASG